MPPRVKLRRVKSAHDPWRAVVQAIDDCVPLDEAWWRESLIPYLSRMQVEVARVLYQDLCRIQIAIYEQTTPAHLSVLDDAIDWSDMERMECFFRTCISNGRLVEFVADCIELPSEEERMTRWCAAEAHIAESTKLQRRHTAHQLRLSEFRVNSRETNRLAYERVVSDISAESEEQNPSVWKVVIRLTPERLGNRTKMFWRGLQVSACTLVEKRALMHKLHLCQAYSCCPEEIVGHIQNLSHELFLAAGTEIELCVKRRWSQTILRTLLRWFVKKPPACPDPYV